MNLLMLKQRMEEAIARLRSDLVSIKGSANHWTGTLSTSALSTATAVSALSISRDQFRKKTWPIEQESGSDRYAPANWDRLIESGSEWLSRAQNTDGGFGDTDRSLSNIATTLLVLAAWQLAGHNSRYSERIAAAWGYVDRRGSWEGLRQRYGKDKTFVVPIMTNCALAGLVDWGQIPTLPFEAAALPQSWYRFVQLPVVSYAIPALVAIGQAQFVHCPPRNPIARMVRAAARAPSLRVLTRMQPTSGGYLEAVPLTSFVLMSLASIGLGPSRVAVESRKFIIDSVLEDGSWPIDTNLATWVTSLAAANFFDVREYETRAWESEAPAELGPAELGPAVVGSGSAGASPSREDLPNRQDATSRFEWDRTIDWLLACQHRTRHAFTGAEPGGWGWTNLSGAVPDSDDTPAALIAFGKWHEAHLTRHDHGDTGTSSMQAVRFERVRQAAKAGCRWLIRLQNRDGGWPTFCRGWGTLPFDRSGSDLTAHAIRALSAWNLAFGPGDRIKGFDAAIERGWAYLEKHQNKNGSWLPLWFGNQDRDEEDNPIYGTGRVLLCYSQCDRVGAPVFQRGLAFLLENQNADGGWGGGKNSFYPGSEPTLGSATSTIEETSVALEGILSGGGTKDCTDSIMRGVNWLCDAIQQDHHRVSQPIGFYFARLWYHEKMYPLVFSLGALNKGLEFCQR